METTLQNLILGFGTAFAPANIFYALLGCLIGTMVGVLPGVGPLAGISMLLPTTFGLDPTSAIILLAGIYYGAMYGGSTTSILMRIPGEAASVMTCIDGYAMTQKGRAGPALAIAAIGSYVAGTLSVVGLMFLAPPLARFALGFGPPEYFSLLLCGLIVLCYMTGGSVVKNLSMIVLGLLLGMIGIDQMSGYFRFSYGIVALGDGLGVVPVAVGLFGISEILLTAGLSNTREVLKPRLRDLLPSKEEWKDSIKPIGRGTVLGFLIGIIPGSAHIISTFVSYAIERRVSRHPERFGEGAIEGVAGPEETFERCRPIFEAMAAKIVYVGPENGLGTTLKLINNLILGVAIQASAEALVLAAKAGIDPRKVMEITSVGGARTGAMETRGPWMVEHNFDPHFSANNMYKDLSNVMKLAEGCGAVLPTAAISLEMLRAARAQGDGERDSCVVLTVLEKLAGL